jgi:hypothetical protein
MNTTGIEATIKYIETFITQEKLSGKELLIISIAFQNGLLQGLHEMKET